MTFVALGGDLDINDRLMLQHALDRTSAATRPDVAVDLREVGFIDCAVVGALLGVSKAVRAQGGCLRLSGLRPGPLRLLDVCRLGEVLCLHDTAASATAVHCSVHRLRPVQFPRIPAQQSRRSPTAV